MSSSPICAEPTRHSSRIQLTSAVVVVHGPAATNSLAHADSSRRSRITSGVGQASTAGQFTAPTGAGLVPETVRCEVASALPGADRRLGGARGL